MVQMSGDSTVSAFPDGDNLFSWVAQITGGSGTIYEGLQYKLSLSFPSRYPYTPPTVKFVTPCYHPNVDTHGNICLDILKEKWSALYDVRTILLSIQSLLAEPNNESPLNVEAADAWEDQDGKIYYLHARFPLSPGDLIKCACMLMAGSFLNTTHG